MTKPKSFLENCDIMLFSKHVKELSIETLCEQLNDSGIHSLDLTVRSRGHVAPENVEEELPAITDDLSKKGIRVGMISTEIVEANETTKKILKTASELGIKYYKLGYYIYQGFGTLHGQREEVREKLKTLMPLNEKYGICAGFHNHSANFFGANLDDVYEVVKDFPKELIGAYFDPAHAVIEGGINGWEMAIDLLAERIIMLAIKDFRWVEKSKGYAGGRIQAAQFCSLAEGNVPWDRVVSILSRMKFQGPVSFHSEYQGKHNWPDLPDDEIVGQTAKDIAFLKAISCQV